MQEFFMDYGLWLLIALLLVIGIVFLLSGRRRAGEPPVVAETQPVAAPKVESVPAPQPVAASPVQTAFAAEAVVPVAPVAPVAPATVAPIEATAAPVAQPIAQPVAQPVADPIPASPAVVATADGTDDLLKLKGVGPKLNILLKELGVTSYAQIAAWGDADISAIDAKLGNFKGRPVRDQWVDQAKYLAAGDLAGFEAKYGKI